MGHDSGCQWKAAFNADNQFDTDPDYSRINAAFGVATVGDAAHQVCLD